MTQEVEQRASECVISAVKAGIAGSNETIKSRVIETLVEAEVTKRAGELIAAIEKIKTLKKEQDKIRPDVKTRDGNGALTEAYTNETWEKLVKSRAQIEKLEAAFDVALNSGDYTKLREIMK